MVSVTGHAIDDSLPLYTQLSFPAHTVAGLTWLGGLLGLVWWMLTGRAKPPEEARRLAERWSMIAKVAMLVVLMSGISLAWENVASFPNLLATSYGRLLRRQHHRLARADRADGVRAANPDQSPLALNVLRLGNSAAGRKKGRKTMSINRRHVLLLGGVFLAGALSIGFQMGAASAHEYELGKLKIEHPWLRAPKDGETKAQLYMFIHNNGDAPDKLIGVKSDKVGKIEIHADPQHNETPTAIVVPPMKITTLAPDGPYVGLLDIKKINPVGWGFELVLVFEKAGEVTIDAAIDAPDAKHAHDAEAMERWEKAHVSQSGAASASHDMHHDHQQMNHDCMDHGSMGSGCMDHGAMQHDSPTEAKQPK